MRRTGNEDPRGREPRGFIGKINKHVHDKHAGPAKQPTWDLLVRATLRSYRAAHGPDEARRRLRRHVDHWPVEARQALAHVAQGQEAEPWPPEKA
jgi:hypothetical protein